MKRRNFIKLLPASAMLPSIIKGHTINALGLNPLLADSLAQSVENNDHVLVIVQLTGGNDGLNTLIPISNYSDYINARNNIAIPENAILSLSNYPYAGLNPAMGKMQEMYTEGKLGIIQAVGYPNPNFSHFRATDIWMSGSNSDQVLNTGWAGRFLNYLYPNFPTGYPNSEMPDPLAIQIGGTSTLTCQGPVQNLAMTISNPDSFYNLVNGNTGTVPDTNAGQELLFLRTISQQTNLYATQITNASNAVTSQFSGYPSGNSLADKLKIVARLIKGGLKTKVYMVSFGSFDTHSAQVNSIDHTTGEHANLLQTVSDAIWAFQKDLNFLGIEDRVLGMTYSEFGRRIVSNASGGTDHGSASPMFIFGTKVENQVLGINPDLSTSVAGSNVPYQYDFRNVYASIMEKWFCLDFSTVESLYVPVVNIPLTTLPIIQNSACSSLAVEDIYNKESIIKIAPNPFTDFAQINFVSKGGYVSIQILDGGAALIDTIVSKELVEGNYSIKYNTEILPIGLYYFRIQNGNNVQVFSALKRK